MQQSIRKTPPHLDILVSFLIQLYKTEFNLPTLAVLSSSLQARVMFSCPPQSLSVYVTAPLLWTISPVRYNVTFFGILIILIVFLNTLTDMKRARHIDEDQDEFEDAASELPIDLLRQPPREIQDSKALVLSTIEKQQYEQPPSSDIGARTSRADSRRSVVPTSRPDANVLTSTPTSSTAGASSGSGLGPRVPSPHLSTRVGRSQGVSVFCTEFYSASPGASVKREPVAAGPGTLAL